MDWPVGVVIRIVTLYPELLGTYGDGGNAAVLIERARRRGFDVTHEVVSINDPLREADLYLVGGGEDGPQRLAADRLVASDFTSRVRDGAYVLGVCAGLQILGESFCVDGSDEYRGVGLVAAVTKRAAKRSVGEIAVRSTLGMNQVIVGFENHGGETVLSEGISPLGRVIRGRGNDGKVDGFQQGRVFATYAHGPVLAMNPWFCDHLLEGVVGETLEPLASIADQLHHERRRALGV